MNLTEIDNILKSKFNYQNLFEIKYEKANQIVTLIILYQKAVKQIEYAKINAINQIPYWRKEKGNLINCLNHLLQFSS